MPGSTNVSNAGIPAYEAALKANHKRYTIYVYPNVNHAFNNDTSNRYDKPAADLAWRRTIAFFKANLGAPRVKAGGAGPRAGLGWINNNRRTTWRTQSRH